MKGTVKKTIEFITIMGQLIAGKLSLELLGLDKVLEAKGLQEE